MKKYYAEAKYNAAFDRCIDIMTRLIQRYGSQVLERQKSQITLNADKAYKEIVPQQNFEKAA